MLTQYFLVIIHFRINYIYTVIPHLCSKPQSNNTFTIEQLQSYSTLHCSITTLSSKLQHLHATEHPIMTLFCIFYSEITTTTGLIKMTLLFNLATNRNNLNIEFNG